MGFVCRQVARGVSGKAGDLGDLSQAETGFLPDPDRGDELAPSMQHRVGSEIQHRPGTSDGRQMAASGRRIGCAQISRIEHTVPHMNALRGWHLRRGAG